MRGEFAWKNIWVKKAKKECLFWIWKVKEDSYMGKKHSVWEDGVTAIHF